MTRLAGVAQLLAAVFWLATAFYCVLASQTFAFEQFLRPELLPPLAAWLPARTRSCTAVVLAVYVSCHWLAGTFRDRRTRTACLVLAGIWTAVAVVLAAVPGLAALGPGVVATTTSFLALVPVLLLAVVDLAGAPPVGRDVPVPRHASDFASCVTAAVGATLISAVVTLGRGVFSSVPSTAAGITGSLLLHLALFAAIFLALTAARAAGAVLQSRRAEAVAGDRVDGRRLLPFPRTNRAADPCGRPRSAGGVGAGVGRGPGRAHCGPWPAGLDAVRRSGWCASGWPCRRARRQLQPGSRRGSSRSRWERGSSPRPVPWPIGTSPCRTSESRCFGRSRSRRVYVSFACLPPDDRWPLSPQPRWCSPSTSPGPARPATRRLATRRWRMRRGREPIRRRGSSPRPCALVRWRPTARCFSCCSSTRTSQPLSLSRRSRSRSERRAPSQPYRPHIFLFVIDSLRRDYVGAYNPAVRSRRHSTPSLATTSPSRRRSPAMGRRAWPVPSIWTGGMLLHKQYVRPFAPMNTLAKLLAAQEYAAVDRHGSHHRHDPARVRPACAARRRSHRQGLPAVPHAGRSPRRDWPRVPWTPTRSSSTRCRRTSTCRLWRVKAASPMSDGVYEGFHAPVASRIESVRCLLRRVCRGPESARPLRRQHHHRHRRTMAIRSAKRGAWVTPTRCIPEVVRIPLLVRLPSRLSAALDAENQGPVFSTDITPTLLCAPGQDAVATASVLRPAAVPRSRDDAARPDSAVPVIAASYGAVYGALLDEGATLYVLDTINLHEHAFALDGGGPPTAARGCRRIAAAPDSERFASTVQEHRRLLSDYRAGIVNMRCSDRPHSRGVRAVPARDWRAAPVARRSHRHSARAARDLRFRRRQRLLALYRPLVDAALEGDD